MIDAKVEKVLNDQMAKEASSSSLYLSMASWCEMKGLEGCTAFLYKQADEERTHMLKIMKYINDAGGHAIIPAVSKPKSEFKDIRELFELLYKSELDISQAIHNLIDVCTKLKDYTTLHFLQWYVSEQHEEEKLARTILDKIDLIGMQPGGLYMFDKEMSSLSVQTEMKLQDAGGGSAQA